MLYELLVKFLVDFTIIDMFVYFLMFALCKRQQQRGLHKGRETTHAVEYF